jgi:hypothetical protein
MESGSKMEARPPALIEAAVRLLVPHAAREHVLGDLSERYASPLKYTVDALRTIPFVLVSQIRRTSPLGSVVIQVFLLSVGLGVGSGPVLRGPLALLAGLLGLVLRDAYKQCVSMSARQVVVDLAVGAGCIVLAQGVLAATQPELLLPPPALIGGAVSFGILFLLRLQNPSFGTHSPQAYAHAPRTLDALLTEVRLYERMNRRGVRIEVGAGLVVAAAFVGPMWFAPNWIMRVGWCLAAAYGLYIAGFVARHASRPMPDGLGFAGSLAFYRHELERRHGYIRTMWWWYLLPFAPAIIFVTIGGLMIAVEQHKPVWPLVILDAAVVILGIVIHFGSIEMARKVRLRIDGLSAAREDV